MNVQEAKKGKRNRWEFNRENKKRSTEIEQETTKDSDSVRYQTIYPYLFVVQMHFKVKPRV